MQGRTTNGAIQIKSAPLQWTREASVSALLEPRTHLSPATTETGKGLSARAPIPNNISGKELGTVMQNGDIRGSSDHVKPRKLSLYGIQALCRRRPSDDGILAIGTGVKAERLEELRVVSSPENLTGGVPGQHIHTAQGDGTGEQVER